MIDPGYISGLSAILFFIGLAGAFTRKHAIIVLMCIEIMLNAVNLNFVAVAMQTGNPEGWVFISIAFAIAASEVAVGFAIFLSLYSTRETINLDEVDLLKH
ncbi:MAG: NADH-quinone oxidoreductase subunit NuoK [Candidatus Poseidoniaceae archaeon]|nr:NADH-quinone oxidoreductase subunit NuoK [Candidatus Poseidoniaceae archaeon]